MDSLLAGVAVAYFHVFHRDAMAVWMRRLGPWLPPVSILLLSPVAFLAATDPFIYTAGFSMVSAGFALLLIAVLYPVKPAPPLGLVGRGMAQLGQVSYAFYLWHGLILSASKWLLPNGEAEGLSVWAYTQVAINFAATLVLAFATTWLVEQPFLWLRDRWFPSRAKSPLTRPPIADTDRSGQPSTVLAGN
jgi:peptidoglycan/LPS O-acetylase OafA/YrhL